MGFINHKNQTAHENIYQNSEMARLVKNEVPKTSYGFMGKAASKLQPVHQIWKETNLVNRFYVIEAFVVTHGKHIFVIGQVLKIEVKSL